LKLCRILRAAQWTGGATYRALVGVRPVLGTASAEILGLGSGQPS